jgi:hypothetical protein
MQASRSGRPPPEGPVPGGYRVYEDLARFAMMMALSSTVTPLDAQENSVAIKS